MNSDGYTQVRNGIMEHLYTGKITPLDFALYFVILNQCDFATGVWFGSARRLVDAVHGTISEHKARGFLRKFVKMKWLKPFKNQSAHKATVTYLVDKFEATMGRNQGDRVNASVTTDWKSPIFSKRNSEPTLTQSSRDSENRTHEKVPCLNTKTEDLRPKTVRVSERELVEDI